MGLKWIGHLRGAEGLPGIPARDLTDDEVEQHGGADALIATGLYARPHEAVVARPPSPRKAESKTEED